LSLPVQFGSVTETDKVTLAFGGTLVVAVKPFPEEATETLS